jgi:hypothetical protein
MTGDENGTEELVESSTTVGNSNTAAGLGKGLKKSKTVTTYRYFHAFQIETVEDGYNSGRVYHIRVENKERCDSIAAMISVSSKQARAAAMKASRFQKSQNLIRRFYNKSWFQLLVSFLILSVSRPLLTSTIDLPFRSTRLRFYSFTELCYQYLHGSDGISLRESCGLFRRKAGSRPAGLALLDSFFHRARYQYVRELVPSLY